MDTSAQSRELQARSAFRAGEVAGPIRSPGGGRNFRQLNLFRVLTKLLHLIEHQVPTCEKLIPLSKAMKLFGTSAERERVGMLRKLDVFSELTFREALEVDELLHERTYEKGEIIFEEGDIGHGIYIVVSGKLRVNPARAFLKDAVLEFGPGETLGELTLFEDAPRFATVVAAERTVMVGLFRAEFTTLLTKNKNIGVKVLVRLSKTMCARVRLLVLGERHTPSL